MEEKIDTNCKYDFKRGIFKGLPIGLGYLPVSFSFGFMAVSGGLPVYMAVLISMTNLTSSGQFAGTNLMIAGANYIEIAITTFIINLRYFLMSVVISQKVDKKMKLKDRLITSAGITDETFAIASTEVKNINKSYMYGLIIPPYLGWAIGTLLGALVSDVLPNELKGAMGIALFAMFIAIIIPPAKATLSIRVVVIISIIISITIKYVPIFDFISDGFRVVITTILGAGLGALIFKEGE